MKNIYHRIIMLSLVVVSCGPTHVVVQTEAPATQPPPPPPPVQEVSYQSFYDELSPYGSWIDYPGYGYVWLPNVGPDFKPYSSDGHWVFTDAGWTWASDYDWGWATFHYGRWFYDNTYGWMWVPGNEWAPAWVSWRQSPNYYGWAPLGPGISGTGANVYVAAGVYNPPSNYWSFVSPQYVTSPHVNNYYVSESKNVTIVNNTTIINTTVTNNNISNNRVNNTTVNNTTVNNTTINNNYRNVYTVGPSPVEVEKMTGTPVRPIPIQTSNKPGTAQAGNGQFALYRPRVNSVANSGASGAQQKPAPAKLVSLNTIPARPHHNSEEVVAPPANNNNASPINNRPNTTPGNAPVLNNKPNNSAPVNNSAAAPKPIVNNPQTNPLPPPVTKPIANAPVPSPNSGNNPNKLPVNGSAAKSGNGNNLNKPPVNGTNGQVNRAKTMDSLNKIKAQAKKPKPAPKPADDKDKNKN